MKKLLISIGSLLIMTFVVVLFTNATESKKEAKKAKAEVTKVQSEMPCKAECNHSAAGTTTCDPEKCKEMNCPQEEGECDPVACPAHKEGQPEAGKMCGSSAACKGMCPMKEAGSK